MKQFSIIVPLFNNYVVVKRCIKSLIDHAKEAQVILYDDNSTDPNFVRHIQNQIKDAKHIKLYLSKKNLGFTKTCNNASKIADRDFLLFLNSDAFLNSKSLTELYKGVSRDNRIAVFGPMTCSTSSEQHIHNIYDSRFKWTDLDIEKYAEQLSKNNQEYSPIDIKLVGGFAFGVKRDAFIQLNSFDQDFEDYGGEKEFCIRVRKAGYRTSYIKHAYIHHLGKMTYSTVDVNIGMKQVEGDRLIEKKHGPNWRNL